MAAENKTQPTRASVDDFLASVPDARRREDSRRLVPIFEKITGEKATMWGSAIVGFGRYHYRYESGREGDAPLTGFSPRKNDLTLYCDPAFTSFKDRLDRLGKHKTGVSCLYLKRLDDVDVDVLEEILTAAVEIARERHSA